MKTTIVGIDCATQNKKVGLAQGKWDGTAVSLEAITVGQTGQSIAHRVNEWLPADNQTLLALDAPLGWPQQLGRQLAAHQAGGALTEPANRLFRRQKVLFYKGKRGQNGRNTILQRLSQHVTLPAQADLLLQNDDALDAAVCVLAGADFLQGQCHPPADLATARKEGWIWVRQ